MNETEERSEKRRKEHFNQPTEYGEVAGYMEDFITVFRSFKESISSPILDKVFKGAIIDSAEYLCFEMAQKLVRLRNHLEKEVQRKNDGRGNGGSV